MNKRKCPRCGNIQNFEEVMEERDVCPIDGIKYSLSCTFELRKFEKRMFHSRCKRQQTVDQIREERILILTKAKKSQRQRVLMEKEALKSSGEDFLKRMRDDLHRRKDRVDSLRKKLRDEEYRKYSFKPVAHTKSGRKESPEVIRHFEL